MSTPLMKQYWEIKSAHPDKILMYRMGDFYEMFFDDAVKAAPIIGIALTSRNKKAQDETPMCGVPHHSIANPVNKLLAAGLKVALCDQIEDPKEAKGIVKRAVTRVLTPGMVFDPETLDAHQPLYLASFDGPPSEMRSDIPAGHPSDIQSVSFLDATTGEAFYFTDFCDIDKIFRILPVTELVVGSQDLARAEQVRRLVGTITVFDFDPESVPVPESEHVIMSSQRLIRYVKSLAGSTETLRPFVARQWQNRLELSQTVLRHLEIFQTYNNETKGSFFSSINRTQTSMGARLLRRWVAFPLVNEEAILKRQNEIKSFISNPEALKELRKHLSRTGDVDRRLGKLAMAQAGPRDLLSLVEAIENGLAAFDCLKKISQENMSQGSLNSALMSDTATLAELIEQSRATFVEDAPISSKQGHIIRQGVNAELDEYIYLSEHSQQLVQDFEQRERESTGISSLKVRYNNVFGYYIEITNTHKDKAPDHYRRKQTLTNAERFFTDELVELERKVLSAQASRFELESTLFEEFKSRVLKRSREILEFASLLAEVDVCSSGAWLAIEQSYVCPLIVPKEFGLEILASRHPVVEQEQRFPFVANDIRISQSGCMLLTGPNMAGKSTLMRQVALSVILAQIGYYLPASSAQLPVFDRIFTRIGASDSLTEGLSTFMVEMKETAEMLRLATSRSLIVLDEIGRGTSTYDGLSLAQSILEYLLTEVGSFTLFATHYHELTGLVLEYPQLFNAHMTVAEENQDIRFLYTLKMGAAKKSYGIQVAKLAGVPEAVIVKASALLRRLEQKRSEFRGGGGGISSGRSGSLDQSPGGQMSLFI